LVELKGAKAHPDGMERRFPSDIYETGAVTSDGRSNSAPIFVDAFIGRFTMISGGVHDGLDSSMAAGIR